MVDRIRNKIRTWLGVVELEASLDKRLMRIQSRQINEAYIDAKFKGMEVRVKNFIEWKEDQVVKEVREILNKYFRERTMN